MITLIDTPGIFDTNKKEEETKTEIVRCITECSPGPHVFLIVLKVEKFTEQEQKVITEICRYFSEDALKYAVIVFTHGDELPTGTKIEEFVSQNKNLSDLVQKCAGRCHVVDNKCWQNQVQNNYRSNQVQVEDLLNTIDKMVRENKGGYYVNEMLQAVDKEIQKEEEQIRQSSSGVIPAEEIRQQARSRVFGRLLIHLAGTGTGVLLGALFGLEVMVRSVIKVLKNSGTFTQVIPTKRSDTAAKAGLAVLVGVSAGFAAAGGVAGGIIGNDATKGAQNVEEAIDMAASAVMEERKALLKQFELNFQPFGSH